MRLSFDEWTQGRALASWGTNAGAEELPFQRWRHFKEAFAPELVRRAIDESPIPVARCLDPFGGSGTTALACQFLGVHPITVELNPYLADLIEAKLTSYNADELAKDYGRIVRVAGETPVRLDDFLSRLPRTFVEPGLNGRWIFDATVAHEIAGLLEVIDSLETENHRRLFRVLLGGVLINVSNVVINGKGRRYRRGWEFRGHDTYPHTSRCPALTARWSRRP